MAEASSPTRPAPVSPERPAPPALTADGAASIRLATVSKSYGTFAAVSGVSLDIAAGESLILLGPSGSGKTTLLQMIAGFIAPDSGAIYLRDRDVTHVSASKRDIGFVFQNFALFPHLTVAENIAFPLSVRRMGKAPKRARVAETIELVGLTGLAGHYPRQLSGGQQQRVALARALAFRPPVLLMDEPLASLDRRLRGSMQLEIRNLQREVGSTVVYVTHDQEEAFALADRIALINHGQVEQSGTPTAIYEEPASRFAAAFVGDANLFLGEPVPGTGSSALRLASGLVLAVGRSMPADGRFAALIRPEKLQLRSTGDDLDPGQSAEAKVVDVVYQGNTTMYTVHAPALGQDVLVRVTNASEGAALRPGEPCVLSWRTSDVWPVQDR